MKKSIELQGSEAAVPAEKMRELHQVTNDILMDTDLNTTRQTTMSVPISSLASLGAAVASVLPALRTVTTTTTINTQGLYTLANAGVGDALKVAKNGNFWGAFKTAGGTSKFAQLQQAGPISASTVTTLPINPAIMLMAVALYSIDRKLDRIEEMQRQIIDFLKCEKESQIEADIQMLSGIISKYKLNWDNEHYVASNHKMVLDIQRTALKNMRSYQKQVSALLEKKQLLAAQNNVESTFADMQKKFKYYRMALYTYSLASLLEIMLGGNFQEEYISAVKADIEQHATDYRSFFEKASMRLEQLGNCAIEAKFLNGFGKASQSAGRLIRSIPGIRNDSVEKIRHSADEFLQGKGDHLVNRANVLKEKAVQEFAPLGESCTSIFTERMHDLIQVYNHTERICFDRNRIYLVGKPV